MSFDFATVGEFYERHLTHQIRAGVPLFVTFNLKGSLPDEVWAELLRERERLERESARPHESLADRKVRHSKMIFAMTDRHLDAGRNGPLHLKNERAAKSVENSILFGVPERYRLFAYCVMPNHVHVLLTPIMRYRKLMQGIKGYTAHEINGLLGLRGQVFWQDESYDHWPRDEEEFFRIIAYIENNPAAAGLCSRPEDWPWSSASKRTRWPIGEPLDAEAASVLRTSAFPG
jgi:REP element-mobilizing transposase RayT